MVAEATMPRRRRYGRAPGVTSISTRRKRMPIHLHPLSRRRLLASTAVAAAGCLLPGWLRAAGGKPVDPDRVALLSDTHVAADPKAVLREVCMFDHLERVRADVLAQPVLPAALIVNGDLALTSGLA